MVLKKWISLLTSLHLGHAFKILPTNMTLEYNFKISAEVRICYQLCITFF